MYCVYCLSIQWAGQQDMRHSPHPGASLSAFFCPLCSVAWHQPVPGAWSLAHWWWPHIGPQLSVGLRTPHWQHSDQDTQGTHHENRAPCHRDMSAPGNGPGAGQARGNRSQSDLSVRTINGYVTSSTSSQLSISFQTSFGSDLGNGTCFRWTGESHGWLPESG